MTPLWAVALMAVPADEPVLEFAAGTPAVRVKLAVTVGDKDPEIAWAGFLDKLFDHFDRDGNGSLSPAEAARVFPVPLDGKSVSLSAKRDLSRAEFREFYRTAGFTPVTVVVKPAADETLALGDALFRYLDRDGDGTVSAAELRDAPSLLRRFDEDENDELTAAELLGEERAGTLPAAGIKLAAAGTRSDGVLKLCLGGVTTLDTASRTLSIEGTLLTVPGGTCILSTATDDPTAAVRAVKGFTLAQFRAAAGDKPTAKSLFENDPAAGVLAGLFDAADRDGDGKLTRAELESFFALVEAGVACRVFVTATDRGRNLFDLVDADGNGRLDLAELTTAAKRITAPLKRDTVPASFRLTVGRTGGESSFGPLPLGTPKAAVKAVKAAAAGPKWFTAMDRNGDGFVSAAEFLGPTALFRRLDTDGDGRVAPTEALAASAVTSGSE